MLDRYAHLFSRNLLTKRRSIALVITDCHTVCNMCCTMTWIEFKSRMV
uniref:Uncharacterized protein n=1 Tax=Arundo donax TaxID=35708 RepID=A0A0A9D9M9_ARUDO